MITHYRVKCYESCFRKKKINKSVYVSRASRPRIAGRTPATHRFFLSKSMPNFNFAELIDQTATGPVPSAVELPLRPSFRHLQAQSSN